MNGRVVKFEGSVHAEADRLLPWWVNGTLEGEERAQVAEHLAECVQCQREVAWLRSLQDEIGSQAQGATDAREAMKRLRRRMRTGTTTAVAPSTRRGWGRRERWLAWTVGLQAMAVLILGGIALTNHRSAADYQTLSTPTTHGALLVVSFDPQLTEGQMRTLVRDSDARIVGGPTQAGAYLLNVSPERANAVRDRLRAARGVTLAERMDVGGER
ncbi:zf-HC2 domain-containing protein [Dyella sp.]|uniref:zf-HC2 domain-containing protein n=1 Tax=Dyella sp. TaxID=1869338 RepID=UPI002ED3E17C